MSSRLAEFVPDEHDPDAGRRRVVIENVQPRVDDGRFAAKRIVGDRVTVTADVFADGHDVLTCLLRYRHVDEADWRELPLTVGYNDDWRGEFLVDRIGYYQFTLEAWIDHFATWQRDLKKRIAAGQNVDVDLKIGAALVEQAASRASGNDRKWLTNAAALLAGNLAADVASRAALGSGDELAACMARWPDRRFSTTSRLFRLSVDRPKARFSAWYELFPRSCAAEPGRHATFRDCERWLPYVAELGFDVLYLPPIHPIGTTHRKGKNNALVAAANDPGSPWAIGGPDGGHKSVHTPLGTIEDFRRFRQRAEQHGLEIALDIAYQCSPDHPYVATHPHWFRARPDGSIQYAENPPKKYQDIYPFDFDSTDWPALWTELRDVVEFWIAQGVHIFRVDNPHTKPFAFWEWMIGDIRSRHPQTLFLSEAFTRPKIMYRLAKLGFTQSYTYFAWRNDKQGLTDYFTELTQPPVCEFFRPNLWPNTPDILNEYLQHGGPAAFAVRLVLAATLGASYGIYGPPFERAIGTPREPGSEEYLDSEKYEIQHWPLDRPTPLGPLIARVNRIRRENPALQSDAGLRFHAVDNDRLIAYSKRSADGGHAILTVVNLDPRERQAGMLHVAPADFGLDGRAHFDVVDLLTDRRYTWNPGGNFVSLDPTAAVAHVFLLTR